MCEVAPRSRTRTGTRISAAVEQILRNPGEEDSRWLETYTQLTESEVEKHLRSISAPTSVESSERSESAWDFIHRSHSHSSKIEAVEAILRENVEALERSGFDSGVLLQYVFSHQLWTTHTDPGLRNAGAWVTALDSHKTIATAMLYGAIADITKQKHLEAINKSWGLDWFDNIEDIRPVHKQSPGELGKTELRHLARIATSGVTLKEACKKIKGTIMTRRRRRMKQKDHRDFMTRQDLENLAGWPQKGLIGKTRLKAGRDKENVPKDPVVVEEEEQQGEEQEDESDRGEESGEIKAEEEQNKAGTTVSATVAKRWRPADEANESETDNILVSRARHSNNVQLPDGSQQRLTTEPWKAATCVGKFQACMRQVREMLAEVQDVMILSDEPGSCCPCCKALKTGTMPECLQQMVNSVQRGTTNGIDYLPSVTGGAFLDREKRKLDQTDFDAAVAYADQENTKASVASDMHLEGSDRARHEEATRVRRSTPCRPLHTQETASRSAEATRSKPTRTMPWTQSVVYPHTGERRVNVTSEDIACLGPGAFLNDTIIDFALRKAEELMAPEHLAKVQFFNSYFFTALTTLGGARGFYYDAVKSWTKHIDIFDANYVVIPINRELHWFMAIICNLPALVGRDDHSDKIEHTNSRQLRKKPRHEISGRSLPCMSTDLATDEVDSRATAEHSGSNAEHNAHRPAVIILDSLGKVHAEEIAILKDYVAAEALTRHDFEVQKADIQGISTSNFILQSNWSDCGLFVIGSAEAFSRDPTGFLDKSFDRASGKRVELETFNAPGKRTELHDCLSDLYDQQVQQKAEQSVERLQAESQAQHSHMGDETSTEFSRADDIEAEPAVAEADIRDASAARIASKKGSMEDTVARAAADQSCERSDKSASIDHLITAPNTDEYDDGEDIFDSINIDAMEP